MTQPSTGESSEEVRQQQLLSVSDNAVLRLSKGGVVTYMNPTALTWLGNFELGQDRFDDATLAKFAMSFCNRKQIPISLEDIFAHPTSYPFVGLTDGEQIRWVKFNLYMSPQDHYLELTDITPLMLEVAELKTQADNANTRDSMTGLYNRRYAMERLHQIHHHAKRYDSNFSVALIDVDHFKRINDTFGHAYGDDVIARLANAFRRSFRETDLCARYGGEEFLILMPETQTKAAIHTLDRLRQHVSELKWNQMQRPVTISCGVIGWQANKSVEQLIFLADQRLNTAKKAGRNQVCGDLV